MTTIIILIIAGLAAGDILGLAIFHLCKMLSEEKAPKKKQNPILEYFNFIMKGLKERKTSFIMGYLLLYSATATVTLMALIIFGITIKGFAALLFCYLLVILTFVDAKTQYLPDIITKPLIALGLVQGYFNIFTDLRTAVIGAVAGYSLLWTINTIFRLVRKKDGMGYGDFKLLSAIAAWVGITQIPLIIMASSIIGIFVAIFMARLPNNTFTQPNPFGPALAFAGIVSLFWGSEIMTWYIGLYSF